MRSPVVFIHIYNNTAGSQCHLKMVARFLCMDYIYGLIRSKSLEVHSFLIQLVVILLAARVFGEMAAYCKIPAVIGEMMAGIIIGPSLLGWIVISDPIQLMAQIGIILLLFEVGLEANINRLSAAGGNALVVAIGGVILPFFLGFWVSYYMFSLSLIISLFAASTLTSTSIGITLRVLRDLKQHDSNEAQIILGAAVLDDIVGIILLALLYEFSMSGSLNWFSAAELLIYIAIFFITAPLVAKIVSNVIQKWDQRSDIPGLIPAIVVSLILLFAWLAHMLGAPELLGGFAAGLAISRQFFIPFASFLQQSPDFSDRVEEQLRPIIQLFTPIFFVSVGLSLNLHTVNWSSLFFWEISGLLLVISVIGKLGSAIFLKGKSFIQKVIIGTAMIPRGEVGLVFANVGLSAGIFKGGIYAAMILVITVTTLLTPISLRWLYKQSSKNEPKIQELTNL